MRTFRDKLIWEIVGRNEVTKQLGLITIIQEWTSNLKESYGFLEFGKFNNLHASTTFMAT